MFESDIHGDQWIARLAREHERHAGIPDYGFCPRSPHRPRRAVQMITSTMLAQQRRDFGYRARVDECEREMRRLTDGDRGCASPDEHR